MDTSSIRQIGAPAPERRPADDRTGAPALPPRRRRSAAAERTVAVLLGALDGLLGVALPLAALVAVAVVGWAGAGGGAPWTSAVAVAATAWLIGHGVDIAFGGSSPFTVTAAALGPALVTALLAVRAGGRAARTAAPAAAWIAGAAAVLIAASLVLPLSAAAARPVAWQAVLLPAALWAVPSLLALRRARARSAPLHPGVRAGLGAAGLVVAAAAVLLALLLAVRFPDVVALTEALGPGAGGGFALIAVQLLVLPTAIVWTAAWTTGAGVALGAGSATGAFGTQLGPLPTLPLLGVVPADPSPLAAAVLLLPVLAGFAAGALAARTGTAGAVRIGAVAGPVAGLLLGLGVLASAGSAGPGRLGSVGPDALLVALLTMLEVGLPAMLGAAVLRPRSAAGGVEPADR